MLLNGCHQKMSAKITFAVSLPLPIDAVKTLSPLPMTLGIRDLLKSRNARLKSFSKVPSQFAPCVMCANVPFVSGSPLTITTVLLSDKL